MSLIVDALKRAQQGAVRHLPFTGGSRPPVSAASRSVPRPGAISRPVLLFVAGLLVVAAAARVWLSTRPASPGVEAAGPPLFVVEPLAESPEATAAVAEPIPVPAATDESGEITPAVAEQAAAAARRTTPSRPRVRPPALLRPLAAGPAFALPSAAPVAPTPPTAPVVEVHMNSVREAADALAAGLADQQRGDFAGAAAQYRRGIAADARNPGLHNNLGLALKESGRLDEAARAFEDALALDPKYEKALNNLGVTRYQQGRYEDAIDLFRRAIRVNPANVQSRVNLGVIYLPAGRWDDALAAFQAALRYDPKSAEAHYNLALLWEQRGDRARALPHYEKFVDLADAHQAALAARVKEYLAQFERRR